MSMSIKGYADEMSVIIPKLHREFLHGPLKSTMTSEISFQQIVVLHIIIENGPLKMSEIARLLFITTSAATGIVDRMVKSGFLKRALEPEDRRVVNIMLTQKGKRTIITVLKERRKIMIEVFKNFTFQERESYYRMVKKIYALISKAKR